MSAITSPAEELRNARKTRNMTLLDVARETGLSVSYLSDIETGRTVPPPRTLERLCKAYNLPVPTFTDAKDDDRYVHIPRADYERMTAMLAELQQMVAQYAPKDGQP